MENELKTPLCSQPSATYSPPISPDGGIARFFPLDLRGYTVNVRARPETICQPYVVSAGERSS